MLSPDPSIRCLLRYETLRLDVDKDPEAARRAAKELPKGFSLIACPAGTVAFTDETAITGGAAYTAKDKHGGGVVVVAPTSIIEMNVEKVYGAAGVRVSPLLAAGESLEHGHNKPVGFRIPPEAVSLPHRGRLVLLVLFRRAIFLGGTTAFCSLVSTLRREPLLTLLPLLFFSHIVYQTNSSTSTTHNKIAGRGMYDDGVDTITVEAEAESIAVTKSGDLNVSFCSSLFSLIYRYYTLISHQAYTWNG